MLSSERKISLQRILRFLMGGGVNTTFTFGVYLSLITVMPYQWAYFIAFALGIAFAYWFNAAIVFKVSLSWKGLFAYPLVYVIQYGISAFGVGFLVEFLRVSERLAPLLILVVTVPLTYVLSKWVIRRTHI